MPFTCLVCEYPKLKAPPHAPSGGGSYEICPACGYQYGVDDEDRGITPEAWRATWVAGGAKWSSVGMKMPKGWQYPAKPTSKKHPSKKMKKPPPVEPSAKKVTRRKSDEC